MVVIHDLFVLTNPEWFSRIYALTHGVALRLQVRSAAGIIAVSQPVADQIKRHFPGKRIIVAPNAPAEVFYSRPRRHVDRVCGEYGLIPGRFVVAVGGDDPRKQTHLLLRAWEIVTAQQPDLQLVVIGGGQNWVHSGRGPSFGAAEENVLFLRDIDDDCLAHLYSGAYAHVSVSIDEGFGLPIVEAQACGTGSILSDIDVYRWVSPSSRFIALPMNAVTVAEAVLQGPCPPAPVVPFTWRASAERVARFMEEIVGRER